MSRSKFCLFLATLALLLAVGCANPAADAPQAEVSEPPAATESMTEPAGTVYQLSPESKVGFVGSKVTGSHEGGFEKFEGTITTDGTIEGSTIEVLISAASLWADNDKLTGHLKSAEFFDVEQFESASFMSTGIAANEDGTYQVTGTLDLHGVAKQISFPATIELSDSGFTANAEFAIKRFDFGLEYPGMADDLIRDDVLIKLDLHSAS